MLESKHKAHVSHQAREPTEGAGGGRGEAPDSPTYSGVPRISRTSVMLSMRRDKPKSTIRMSPRGVALVSSTFWGCR